MPEIKVDMTGMDRVQRALHNLADQIENPSDKLMRRLGEVSLDDVTERFMDRGHGTWAPDSEETVKRKGNAMVLIDTGAMYASAEVFHPKKNTVGVIVPYGGRNHSPDVPKFHQYGTSKMPQRKIVEVTPQLNNALMDAMQKWVDDMIMAFVKGI